MIVATLLLAAAAPQPLMCGAVTRPGIAQRGEDGIWRGTAVATCRVIAQQLDGPGARIIFHSYDNLATLRAAASDRIAFVSSAELKAAPGLRAGRTIAIDRQVLAVHSNSSIQTAAELRGMRICFIIGTRAEEALNVWEATGMPIIRMAFQEPAEMRDAFAVNRCAALAVDEAEMSFVGSRILEPPLASTPILAAVPAAAHDRRQQRIADLLKGQQPTEAEVRPWPPGQ